MLIKEMGLCKKTEFEGYAAKGLTKELATKGLNEQDHRELY